MAESGGTRSSSNGVTPADLRRVNERVVIDAMGDSAMGDGADLWRVADLMRATGLTRVTVVDVLRGLQDKDWVAGEPVTPGGRGRPATGFRRRVPAGLVAGLDVGAHRVQVSVADLAGRVRAHVVDEVTPDLPRGDRLEVGRRLLLVALEQARAEVGDGAGEMWSVLAATTGTVGSDGRVLRSAAIADWAGLDLATELSARLGVGVEVRNDVQLVGAAEQQWGVAAGADHIMLLWLGRRPSVSLVLDGRPYVGAHGVAGDLSRSGLLPEEAAWRGEGTWLDLAATPKGESAGDPFDAALEAAEAADADAVRAFETWFERLAPVVSLFAAVVDPAVIVLGGPIASLGERLAPILQADLGRHLQERPRIVVSEFGSAAVADSAARTAVRRVFERLLDNDGRGAAPLRREELVGRERHSD